MNIFSKMVISWKRRRTSRYCAELKKFTIDGHNYISLFTSRNTRPKSIIRQMNEIGVGFVSTDMFARIAQFVLSEAEYNHSVYICTNENIHNGAINDSNLYVPVISITNCNRGNQVTKILRYSTIEDLREYTEVVFEDLAR